MVYLLHFDRPYAHARHFIGVARGPAHALSIAADPTAHASSPLLTAAARDGVKFQVAKTWPGDGDTAFILKHRQRASRTCPLCFRVSRRSR